MAKFTHWLKVGVAEAAHLLHEANGPRELFLGFTEEVLNVLGVDPRGMNTVPPPPVGAAPVTPDTRDAEIAAQKAYIAALEASVTTQIARLTAAHEAALPPVTPPPTDPTPPTS